jgi:hypothetical protein
MIIEGGNTQYLDNHVNLDGASGITVNKYTTGIIGTESGTEQERKKSVLAQPAIYFTDALNEGTIILAKLRRS